jgi:hypothetical protein
MTQDEDLNVKKDRPTVRPMRLPVGPIRRTLFATSELMRGFSLASADGWRAFSNAVDPEISKDEDLARDVTDAMFDANRHYFDDMGATSRRFVDAILDEGSRIGASTAHEIDYEKLAKMVAAEMQKQAADTPPTATVPGSEG